MDSFAKGVGVNRKMIAFHGFNMARINAAKVSAEGVNLLGMLLAPDVPLRHVLGYGWNSVAMTVMRRWPAMVAQSNCHRSFTQQSSVLVRRGPANGPLHGPPPVEMSYLVLPRFSARMDEERLNV